MITEKSRWATAVVVASASIACSRVQTAARSPGSAEAGSLARYARHVSGISSSKGALRARCRAERTR